MGWGGGDVVEEEGSESGKRKGALKSPHIVGLFLPV